MNIDLYFVVRMKRGEVLYPTHGPFTEYDPAKIVADAQEGRSCYSDVVKVTLPCEVCDA